MKTCHFYEKTYCARILIESARFPPSGFDIKEIGSDSHEDINEFTEKTDRGRILIESARFPPFGFDIKEIGSDSHEDIMNLQKN